MGILDYFGGGDKKSTRDTSQTTTKDVSGFRAIQAPTATDLQVQLTQAILQGKITPQEAEDIFLEKSKLEGLEADPKLEEAQFKALGQIQALANSDGGMTPQTVSAINKIYDDFSQKTRAASEGISEQAEQQGLGSSNLKFALQQQAGQNSAQNAARFYADTAADQENQRIQAIKDSASLAGGLSQQDLARKQAIAEAQDTVNKFNTANKINTQQFNISNDLDAQKSNLAARQNVENQNVDIKNQQAIANNAAKQQAFNNQLAKQKEIAEGKVTTTGNIKDKEKGDKGEGVGNLLSTAAGIYGLYSSDKRNKENIQEMPDSLVDEILADIKPYSYNYKKKMDKPGNHVGIMAQDAEKSPISGVVKETPLGKMIDGNELSGVAMGLISNLHNRLKNLEGKK